MDFCLRRVIEVIESATQGMNSEELRAHPSGKWCAAEIVEHLLRTFTSTSEGLRRCLDAGRATARTPSMRDRVATWLVVEIGYLPSGRPAPKYALPRGLPAESVLAEVRAAVTAMDGVINQCEQRFGTVRIADHPILGPLTARQWRRFHWIHTRHHMKQIARLRSLKLAA